MHLLKLEGFLKLTGSSFDVKKKSSVEHCIPPITEAFLRFPFLDTGQRLNEASTDLFLLDHLWFKFQEGKDNALWEPVEGSGAFKNVMIFTETYKSLKDDCLSRKYEQWLSGEHLDFFAFWMTRNKQFPVVQATAILDTKVTTCIQKLANKNSSGLEQSGVPISMKNIHLYLMNNLDLLSKKFVFFPLHEGGNHWSGWVAVNPWVQLARVVYQRAKYYKKDKQAYRDLKGYAKVANGLIACDGLHVKEVSETRQIIWF